MQFKNKIRAAALASLVLALLPAHADTSAKTAALAAHLEQAGALQKPRDASEREAAERAEAAAAETAAAKKVDVSTLEVYGANLFAGAYAQESFSGFNPNYVIAIGDRISIKVWGAFTAEVRLVVDAQGNIFVPNVGPVRVLGVTNGELNRIVEEASRKVYRAGVNVYATLESAQPVKVFVAGGVTVPGLYGGLSSDSLLYYLHRAGGIDLKRGSFIDVTVKRGDAVRGRFSLYEFVRHGKLPLIQLQDGDTIVVAPRKSVVKVAGEVSYATAFEFTGAPSAAEIFELARPAQVATHFAVIRQEQGGQRTVRHLPIAEATKTQVHAGDEIVVSAERSASSILVRVDGTHSGERALAMPYGATLGHLMERLRLNALSRLDAVQVFRPSVAERQKRMIESELARLERMAFVSGSSTTEESAIRAREAEMISKFVAKARTAEPKGQLVLEDMQAAQELVLADGDTVVIPERTTLVALHGEVNFPASLAHKTGYSVDDYASKAGGYTSAADRSRVVLIKANGVVVSAKGAQVEPGDEILVLPKVETKTLEVSKAISTLVYQLAVSAKIVFGL